MVSRYSDLGVTIWLGFEKEVLEIWRTLAVVVIVKGRQTLDVIGG